MKILKPYCSKNFKGSYNHVNSVVFDRITISYGFYNRTVLNALKTGYFPIKAECVFDFPFGEGWYFGVNLRIKCQQGQKQNQKNIDKATRVSKSFCKYTIPHYTNTNNDQGVDFFVFPIIIRNKKSLEDFLDGWCNADGFKNKTVQNILENIPENFKDIEIINNPDDIDKWVEDKMNELLNLYENKTD